MLFENICISPGPSVELAVVGGFSPPALLASAVSIWKVTCKPYCFRFSKWYFHSACPVWDLWRRLNLWLDTTFHPSWLGFLQTLFLPHFLSSLLFFLELQWYIFGSFPYVCFVILFSMFTFSPSLSINLDVVFCPFYQFRSLFCFIKLVNPCLEFLTFPWFYCLVTSLALIRFLCAYFLVLVFLFLFAKIFLIAVL